MSNLDPSPPEIHHHHHGAADIEVITARDVPLGGPRAMMVRRTLPHRDRSLIGAWCFADHYGPSDSAMDVPPHPHTSLQTVTWLFSGEVEHRDSLGTAQLIRPGEMNLMTAGHGISHSEVSTADSGQLHGVQLWVALPDGAATGPGDFVHYRAPRVDLSHLAGVRVSGAGSALVFLGSLGTQASPVATATALMGAQLDLEPGTTVSIETTTDFEYGVLVDTGDVRVDGQALAPAELAYVPPGRAEITIEAAAGPPGRVILLGGEPFTEDVIMWWNFIGRTHDEIVQAREQWQERAERFGSVEGYDGSTPWLPAPALPAVTLKARRRPSTM